MKAGCGLASADAAADLAVLNATAIRFTLGALTLEQTSTCRRRDTGPLTGLEPAPGLRAWQQHLGAIGNQVDPLALQRRMTAALLAHLPPPIRCSSPTTTSPSTPLQASRLGPQPRRGKATKAHGGTYVSTFRPGPRRRQRQPSGLSLTLPARPRPS